MHAWHGACRTVCMQDSMDAGQYVGRTACMQDSMYVCRTVWRQDNMYAGQNVCWTVCTRMHAGQYGGRTVWRTGCIYAGQDEHRQYGWMQDRRDARQKGCKTEMKQDPSNHSVVDPNTLNVDPDPESEFWPNSDPDPDPMLSSLKEKI